MARLVVKAKKKTGSISISKQPIKLQYYVDEVFDPTGIEFTINYNDGTSKIIDYSEIQFNQDMFPKLSLNDTIQRLSIFDDDPVGSYHIDQAITVIENPCQSSCMSCQSCTTSCQTSCQSCTTTCESSCQSGQHCTTACETSCLSCQGCQACELNCQSSCTASCTSCTTTCTSACTASCTSCTAACESSCQGSSGGCQGCMSCQGCQACELSGQTTSMTNRAFDVDLNNNDLLNYIEKGLT